MIEHFQHLTAAAAGPPRPSGRRKSAHKKRWRALCAAVFSLLAASPALARPRAEARLIGLDGRPRGAAHFTQTSHGVLIALDLAGLPPGWHAIHIHTTAACYPKTLFTSAGPDLSFTIKPHGYLARGGAHAGDLPNAYAGPDGVLRANLLTNAFSLGNGKKSIFDRDGASIMVHANADDYRSQPDGHAGPRIACGTIVRTEGPRPRKSRRKGR